jgi:hypothetical protein
MHLLREPWPHTPTLLVSLGNRKCPQDGLSRGPAQVAYLPQLLLPPVSLLRVCTVPPASVSWSLPSHPARVLTQRTRSLTHPSGVCSSLTRQLLLLHQGLFVTAGECVVMLLALPRYAVKLIRAVAMDHFTRACADTSRHMAGVWGDSKMS